MVEVRHGDYMHPKVQAVRRGTLTQIAIIREHTA